MTRRMTVRRRPAGLITVIETSEDCASRVGDQLCAACFGELVDYNQLIRLTSRMRERGYELDENQLCLSERAFRTLILWGMLSAKAIFAERRRLREPLLDWSDRVRASHNRARRFERSVQQQERDLTDQLLANIEKLLQENATLRQQALSTLG